MKGFHNNITFYILPNITLYYSRASLLFLKKILIINEHKLNAKNKKQFSRHKNNRTIDEFIENKCRVGDAIININDHDFAVSSQPHVMFLISTIKVPTTN